MYMLRADLERSRDDLAGVVKAERRDLRAVGGTGVGDCPTATKRVQQQMHRTQLLRCNTYKL